MLSVTTQNPTIADGPQDPLVASDPWEKALQSRGRQTISLKATPPPSTQLEQRVNQQDKQLAELKTAMSSMEKRQDAVQKDVNQVHQQIKKLDTSFDESLRKCVAQQDRRMKDGFDELKSLLMEMSASGARPPSKRVRDVEDEDEEMGG